MRLLLVGLIALLPLQTFAERRGTPFHPAVDERFNEMENDSAEGDKIARKYLKVTYEPAVDGGNSASTNNLGVYLPTNAIITSALFYVNTAFAGEGGGVRGGYIAFQCAGTRDLMEYQDVDAMPVKSFLHSYAAGATALGATGVIGTSATVRIQGLGSSIASRCQIAAVVRGDSGDEDYASGKGTLLVEYFIAN